MARYVPPSSTPAKAATPRTSDEYEWEMAEWESYGGKKPRAPTSTEKNLWAAAELEANPRSRADYMLELKDAEDFGNPKPLPPTATENTLWAEELAAEEADRKSAASKQYATRAEGQARTPERLKGLRDVLGRGRPLLTTLSPEVRADAKSASDTIARADFYRDKPEKLVSKQFKGEVTDEVLDRIRSDLDANAAQARQNLASLGLDPGQKVPVTRAIQRPTLTPAEVLGTTTQPEPAVADTPKKPRAKPMIGTTPRSKNSIPRLQGELFGIPPVEYGQVYTPPGTSMVPTHTMGPDMADLYAASGNQQLATSRAQDLARLGIVEPQPGSFGDLARQGGALARPSYPVALDQPGMVLNRPALGYGGMEFVERVPPAALGAPPMQPPPPAAPGAPGMMSRAGNALLGGAQYLGGVLARTAPVLDVALPGILDHDAEVAATMRAMQSQVGGGRGTMPASAYPAGMEALLGVSTPAAQALAPNSRGQGFTDPRLVRRPVQTAAPVRRPVRAGPVASPWVPMAMDPSVLMQTPVVSSPLPVGNANIDDETRRRAYRAMGLLP